VNELRREEEEEEEKEVVGKKDDRVFKREKTQAVNVR